MHEFFFENLQNPAHIRRVGLMRQFSSGQLYSRGVLGWPKFTLVPSDFNKFSTQVIGFTF
jgi:hypothetical protein